MIMNENWLDVHCPTLLLRDLKMFCQNCRIAELKPRILAWQFYCLIIYKSFLRMLIPVDKSCCVRNLSVRICAITITINILEMYNCQRKRVCGCGKTRLSSSRLIFTLSPSLFYCPQLWTFYRVTPQFDADKSKDDKNKIIKHAEINRHLEFVAADFYM